MNKSGETGKLGEDLACAYLTEKGYRILQRNFRCRLGEIDIIAQTAEFLVFVEVKLRKNDRYGSAAEYVTTAKQARIRNTAKYYLTYRAANLQPRFDVIEVTADNGKVSNINHIEDAFQ